MPAQSSEPKKPLKRKAPYQPPKPTKEQIAERQAMKQAKRDAEAKAAASMATAATPTTGGAALTATPKDEVVLKKEGKVQESRSKSKGKSGKAKSEALAPSTVKEGPPIVKDKPKSGKRKRDSAGATPATASA